jgi:hypothetical protein
MHGDGRTLEAALAGAGALFRDPLGEAIELGEALAELVEASPDGGKKPHAVAGWRASEGGCPPAQAFEVPVETRGGGWSFPLRNHVLILRRNSKTGRTIALFLVPSDKLENGRD